MGKVRSEEIKAAQEVNGYALRVLMTQSVTEWG